MLIPVFNVLVGLGAVGAALVLKYPLIGTKSPELLVVVGAAIVGYGIYGIVRARKNGPSGGGTQKPAS